MLHFFKSGPSDKVSTNTVRLPTSIRDGNEQGFTEQGGEQRRGNFQSGCNKRQISEEGSAEKLSFLPGTTELSSNELAIERHSNFDQDVDEQSQA